MNFIEFLHYLIFLYIVVAPFILNKKYIIYYIIVMLIMIFHWYFFDGQCILTLREKKNYKNGFIIDTMDKYRINRIGFDLLIYGLLLYSFFKINRLYLGCSIVILILLLNKIVYKQLNFKIVQFN